MGDPNDQKPATVRVDKLILDFGKNLFGLQEKADKSELAKQKAIPEPGRTPPATMVPEDEILNPTKKDEP